MTRRRHIRGDSLSHGVSSRLATLSRVDGKPLYGKLRDGKSRGRVPLDNPPPRGGPSPRSWLLAPRHFLPPSRTFRKWLAHFPGCCAPPLRSPTSSAIISQRTQPIHHQTVKLSPSRCILNATGHSVAPFAYHFSMAR